MMSDGGALPSPALIAAVRNGALTMAASHAKRLAEIFARHQGPDARARSESLAVAPVPTFRHTASTLLGAWSAEPTVRGMTMASALWAAVETAEAIRATQALDVVWTGPASAEVPVRLTREVLLDVISGASASLIIVSYAAYRVPDIVQALADAVARGVDVRLVLESAEGSQRRLSFNAADAFRGLSGVRFYEWPAEQRRSASGLMGSLHAKVAIADDSVAFVTSANLTGSAIEANMELGLLIRGGPAPRRLAKHFRLLLAVGNLIEVDS